MNQTQAIMQQVVNKRHALNMSVATLAQRAGVAEPTVYLFEQHARTPGRGCRVETLLALAGAVGLVVAVTDPAEENTAASGRAA